MLEEVIHSRGTPSTPLRFAPFRLLLAMLTEKGFLHDSESQHGSVFPLKGLIRCRDTETVPNAMGLSTRQLVHSALLFPYAERFAEYGNEDVDVTLFWNVHTYGIEDIGILSFRSFLDTNNGKTTFAVDSVRWTFSSSRLFSEFEF